MKPVTAGQNFVQAQIDHSVSGSKFTGVLTARISEAAGSARNENTNYVLLNIVTDYQHVWQRRWDVVSSHVSQNSCGHP